MAVEKTQAYILKTIPYRESSCILYLLTESYGIVHGIAKGIRKQKSQPVFFERGFLVETLLYTKPNRDLHTLAEMNVVQFFPRLRMNLFNTALRDTAFETILKNIRTGYPYPELFSMITSFLKLLEHQPANYKLPTILWKFYLDFSAIIGFELDTHTCISCSNSIGDSPAGAYLIIEKGGFVCNRCSPLNTTKRNYLSNNILRLLTNNRNPGNRVPDGTVEISPAEAKRITMLLASYCQYHNDTGIDNKALNFLEMLLHAPEKQSMNLS